MLRPPGKSLLIHFDHAVNFPHKPEAGQEPDCTCEQEEAEHHDRCVTEVKEGGGCSLDIQLGYEVMDAVDCQIEGCEARGKETSPPPMIVLRT